MMLSRYQFDETKMSELPIDAPPLSVKDALHLMLQHAPAAKAVESVKCIDANGRVLARDQVADRDVPDHDNSAMDGYAVRAQDIGPVERRWFPVQERIPAGRPGGELAPGSAARIFTGAPIPVGADAVVKQELCGLRGGQVGIRPTVRVGENIRPRGEDFRRGTAVLQRGMQLRPPEIALAAALGLTELPVFRKPRVAVLSTGSEVVEPGSHPREGQIFDANRYALITLVKAIGCEAVDCGHLSDNLEQTCQGILAASSGVDLIISTGGISVGDEDHVRRAIEREGQLHLWRVAIKPGKPVAFGTVGDTLIFGLPGNPIAAFVTFLVLVRPFLKRMLGLETTRQEGLRIAAEFTAAPAPYRRRFLRARIGNDASGAPQVTLHEKQGSAILTTLSWADGLVEIPEGETVEAGQMVTYLPFSELLS